MSEKFIKTRIGLKYDLYANWTAKGNWVDGVFTADANGTSTYDAKFVPLKGEVIFYEIPSEQNPNVMQTTPPAILFKVGDGTKTLSALPWGSAIAADVYAWAKQQSLLGGTYSETTGWSWSTDNAYKQEQDEVAAFIKKETANIKIKVEQLGDTAGVNAGKYQTYISNDGGHTWEATGNPFEIELTDYTAGNGINLDAETNKFSVKLKEGEDNLVVEEAGLSAKVAKVTYTAASTPEEGTPTSANLTVGETTGLLDETAVGEIKGYVDAKAGEAITNSALTISETPITEGYLKSYIFTQNSQTLGTINIPKDFLVKSATIDIVTETDKAEGGKFANDTSFAVGDKYFDFVINTIDEDGTESHVYLNAKDLVDAYEGGNTNFINVEIDENNVITATAKTQLISSASGRTYTFTSHSAETGGEDYSTGKVEVVKVEDGKTYVKVIENTPDTDFVGNVYYVNSVFGTGLPEGRLQLNDNSGLINVWVKLTDVDGSDVDGLATALDVKRYVEGYVEEQLAANVPNVVGQEAITVTEGNTSKTVSLKLNDVAASEGATEHVSGLKQSVAGLEINDTITWILNCGGAGITDNTSGTDEA